MPNEPEVNAYHYVIGPSEAGKGRPYWGPFKAGCRVGHWTTLDDLVEAYFSGNHPDDP